MKLNYFLKNKLSKIIFFGFIIILLLILFKDSISSTIFKNIFTNKKIIDNSALKILTTSDNIFELKKNSQIYIYLKNFKGKKTNLSIYGFSNKNPKKHIEQKCNSIPLVGKKNYMLKFVPSDLIGQECLKYKSFMYVGEISLSYDLGLFEKLLIKIFKKMLSYSTNSQDIRFIEEDKIYTFYFNLEKKLEKKNEALVIFPTSSFPNYFSNLDYVNNYLDRSRPYDLPFVKFANEAPIHLKSHKVEKMKLLEKNSEIIKSYEDLGIKLDIDYDYNFENNIRTWSKYKIIIFPNHSEYFPLSKYKKMKELLINSNEEKRLLIHDPNSFTREHFFKKNKRGTSYFEYKLDFDHPLKKELFEIKGLCEYKNINFTNERYIEAEGYTVKRLKKNDDWPFYFKCKDNDNLYSAISFNKINKLSIIRFNVESLGYSFTKTKKIKNKLLNFLDIN